MRDNDLFHACLYRDRESNLLFAPGSHCQTVSDQVSDTISQSLLYLIGANRNKRNLHLWRGVQLLVDELLEGLKRIVKDPLRPAVHVEEAGAAVEDQGSNTPAFDHRIQVAGTALEAHRQPGGGGRRRSFAC